MVFDLKGKPLVYYNLGYMYMASLLLREQSLTGNTRRQMIKGILNMNFPSVLKKLIKAFRQVVNN